MRNPLIDISSTGSSKHVSIFGFEVSSSSSSRHLGAKLSGMIRVAVY